MRATDHPEITQTRSLPHASLVASRVPTDPSRLLAHRRRSLLHGSNAHAVLGGVEDRVVLADEDVTCAVYDALMMRRARHLLATAPQ
eukprot:COSAG01_NODE_66_length_29241_cov_17.772768_31_plen_87_part_00